MLRNWLYIAGLGLLVGVEQCTVQVKRNVVLSYELLTGNDKQ